MKKVAIAILILLGVTGLGLVAISGFNRWKINMNLRLINPILFQLNSPAHVGDALFLEHGLQDRSTTFYVRDPHIGTAPIWISMLHEETMPDFEVVWSKDGSIVAHRFAETFRHAYDFQQHQPIRAPWDISYALTKPNDQIHTQDEAIETLIKNRGGKGKAIVITFLGTPDTILRQGGRKLNSREYDEFVKAYSSRWSTSSRPTSPLSQ